MCEEEDVVDCGESSVWVKPMLRERERRETKSEPKLTLVLGPDFVTWGVVVDASEVGKLVKLIRLRDPQLVRKFPSSSFANAYSAPNLGQLLLFLPRALLVIQHDHSPNWPASSVSPPLVKGCEQQVLVHILGKVIFSSARFWSKRWPV